jgi:hypothetical protein
VPVATRARLPPELSTSASVVASPKGFLAFLVPADEPPKALFRGQGRVHVAIQTRQTILTNRWQAPHLRFGRGMRTTWHWLPSVVALAITPLVLGSCTGLIESRTDIAHLRADLHATTETLLQLEARVDELGRRQVASDKTVGQMRQELSQAIEVLLKRALVTESRLAALGTERNQPKGPENPDRQVRQQSSAMQSAALQGKDSLQGRKHISLGMTQEDVRHSLGEPISVENTGLYIFWQYSQINDRKYVVFDKATLQVAGWRGL